MNHILVLIMRLFWVKIKYKYEFCLYFMRWVTNSLDLEKRSPLIYGIVCTENRLLSYCKILQILKTMPNKQAKFPTNTTNRRNPSQTRSRERVQKILLAVKTLIEKEGITNLKIGAIAKQAGISPSSIYQYFSDKETMIIALAEDYMQQIRAIIEKNLNELEYHAQIVDIIRNNFLDIYHLQCEEVALREIWFEVANPKLNQLAFEDTQTNVNLIMQRLTPFIEESKLEPLAEFVTLISHQFASTLSLGLADQEKGLHFVEMHIQMVANSLKDYIDVDAF